MQANNQVSKQASRKASKQASKQVSKQVSKQAGRQASRQGSRQALRGHSVGAMPWRGLFKLVVTFPNLVEGSLSTLNFLVSTDQVEKVGCNFYLISKNMTK